MTKVDFVKKCIDHENRHERWTRGIYEKYDYSHVAIISEAGALWCVNEFCLDIDAPVSTEFYQYGHGAADAIYSEGFRPCVLEF